MQFSLYISLTRVLSVIFIKIVIADSGGGAAVILRLSTTILDGTVGKILLAPEPCKTNPELSHSYLSATIGSTLVAR